MGVCSPHLIQRLATSHPLVDVHQVAAEVDAMAGRREVRNPDGLLVTWVRKADRQRQEADIRLAAVRGEAQERQARFLVELLRTVSVNQLGPATIAETLARAQANGLGKVNSRVIERLRQLGEEWPE